MRTSKPIATISYNTEPFLKAKLEELHRNHKIDDWVYIRHDPEEDEKKAHFHVWLSPNRLIDTMDLQDFFNELDPTKPDKPLKCLPFSVSKQDDWILYGMHLPAYLATKGETRQFLYGKEDFVYCDEDVFERAYKHALKGSEWAQRNMVLQLINDGTATPAELILSGVFPISMANQLAALESLRRGGTYRNGRPNHEDDPEVIKAEIEEKEKRRAERKKAYEEGKKKREDVKKAKKAEEELKEAISENPFI